MTRIYDAAVTVGLICDALTGWPIGHGRDTVTIDHLDALGMAQMAVSRLSLDERDHEVAARALEDAADALLPPYNCELRPDGSEDTEMAKWVHYCFETDTFLRSRAADLRKA